MRLLVITPEYPPYIKGGIGKHTGELCTELAEHGHEVTVVALAPVLDLGQVLPPKHSNLKVQWCLPLAFQPHDFTAKTLQHNVQTLSTCLHLPTLDYDLVVLQHFTQGLAAVHLSHIKNIPLIWHSHAMYSATLENSEYPNPELQYFREFERMVGQAADNVIAISPYIANLCDTLLSIPQNRITTIPKSIHIKEFSKKKYNVKNKNDRQIAFVGRLSWEKGLENLFEAVYLLKKKNFIACLQVAGVADDQSYIEHLKEKIKEFDLGKQIVLRGFLGGADLIHFYQQADVVAIPSIYEAFGRVAIEAMAAGTPVVATAVGGLKDVITDNYNGLLVSSTEELAEKLQLSLENAELAARLREHGIETVKDNYAWPHVFKQTVDCYQAAVANRHSR